MKRSTDYVHLFYCTVMNYYLNFTEIYNTLGSIYLFSFSFLYFTLMCLHRLIKYGVSVHNNFEVY